jgi:hypothetical protein
MIEKFKKVEKLLDDFQPEHSQFQIENFIIGTHKHIWEQYKQALRELDARHNSMVNSHAAIEQIKAETKKKPSWLARIFGQSTTGDPERLAELEKKYASKSREYDAFYKIAKDLKDQIGDVTEGQRRELEMESWIYKAKMTAAIDLLSIGGLQRPTVEFIIKFPVDIRKQILNDLKPESRQKLLSILEN